MAFVVERSREIQLKFIRFHGDIARVADRDSVSAYVTRNMHEFAGHLMRILEHDHNPTVGTGLAES